LLHRNRNRNLPKAISTPGACDGEFVGKDW
jgi:hypothetical protein